MFKKTECALHGLTLFSTLRRSRRWLTVWSSPRGSSGFSAAPPTAALLWCRRWRRRKSRGEGRYPAWAACRAAGSPGYACLERDRQILMWWHIPHSSMADFTLWSKQSNGVPIHLLRSFIGRLCTGKEQHTRGKRRNNLLILYFQHEEKKYL